VIDTVVCVISYVLGAFSRVETSAMVETKAISTGNLLATRHEPWTGIMMEFAQPLHGMIFHSVSYHIFPSTWCRDLCSHISLKNTTRCVCIPPPDAKLDKVPELFGDSLMPD
jgi:hypothetical protein